MARKFKGNNFFDKITAATLQVGATSVTSLTASLAPLIGAGAAGTATASKVPVLGTNKNLDTLAIADGGLKLGSGAGTAVTATAAQLNALANNTSGVGFPVLSQELSFTETSGDGTYTGTISLPAGSTITDIIVSGVALWTAGTSASLIVGDGTDPDGFYVATNLKATDLLAGEALTLEHPGGLAGVYIASEQRVLYSATARSVIAVITKVGTGTAGRTRVVVTYTVCTATAVAKA